MKSSILPIGIRPSRGRLFCALLLGLMMLFSSSSKGVKVPEPVERPTLKNNTAPNQGVTFNMDTT